MGISTAHGSDRARSSSRVIAVIVRQDDVVGFEFGFDERRFGMDKTVGRALVGKIRIDLDNRSGARFESEGTLAVGTALRLLIV